MNDRTEFPYEVWAQGRYVNAWSGLVAAKAKASLLADDLGVDVWVYTWDEERWLRRPTLIVPPWDTGRPITRVGH